MVDGTVVVKALLLHRLLDLLPGNVWQLEHVLKHNGVNHLPVLRGRRGLPAALHEALELRVGGPLAHPLVLHHLTHRPPLLGVHHQHLADQLLALCRHKVRNPELPRENTGSKALQRLSVKW
uniref:Putative secreted protein n=1 Tax=Ixodes ricinus TaxID=34613 RepID=A0A6B0UPG5_IXORI